MTTVYFVRHAQPNYDNHDDLTRELTEKGLRDRLKVAEALKEIPVHAVLSSPYKRAVDTVQPLADRLGLPVHPHKGLREIFAGEWEGKTFTYLLATYPKSYAGLWRNDIGNSICDGGESVAQLQQRVCAAAAEIARANDGKTIVIATHATPIRCMECLSQGRPLSEMKDIPWVSNASITEFRYENGIFTEIVSSYDKHLGSMVSTLPRNV